MSMKCLESNSVATFNPWSTNRSLETSPERQSITSDQSLQPPRRSYTLPSSVQHKPIHRIRFEDDGHIIQNPRRQSTADTKFSASFEETAPWDQKTVLSFDGGGIRGYSALLIVKEIMNAIKKRETTWPAGPNEADGPAKSSHHPLPPNPIMATDARSLNGAADIDSQPDEAASQWLPCHYFDYIAGTSTGGLISIMLGRLRMNIDDCISDYERLGGEVFGHSRWFHIRSPLWFPRDKYNHKDLERVIQDVVLRRSPKIRKFPGGQNFNFDENRCRTVVLSYQQHTKEDEQREGVERPYLFRSYKNLRKSDTAQERETDRNPGPAHDIEIWLVARATSAAPGYFKPAKIRRLKYLDGGFGDNNPCGEIFEEVRKMNNHTESCVSSVLSVGTGKDKKWSRFKRSGPSRFINFLNVARKWASESEATHEGMVTRVSGTPLQYFRLNVEDGLGSMKLDEWHARGPFQTTIGPFIGRLRETGGLKSTKPDYHASKAIGHADKCENDSELANATTPQARLPNGHPVKDGKHIENATSSASQLLQRSSVPPWFQPRNKTLEAIRKHTSAYLHKPEVQEWIKDIAEILVKGRRDRAKGDPQRWEKACFGAWYQCKVKGCPRGEKEYGLRRSLQKHLWNKHAQLYPKEDKEAIEKALDDFKIVVH